MGVARKGVNFGRLVADSAQPLIRFIMDMPTPEEREFIRTHARDELTGLALKLSKCRTLDASRVIRQVRGMQVVAKKVPSWSAFADNLLFPHLLSLEQCSSETTARYKAALLQTLPFQPIRRMADLTGGLGVDCWFLSREMDQADYVERQAALCAAAQHNFSVLGGSNLRVNEADSLEYLTRMEPVDLLYLDPARRSADGGKVVVLSDCEPDVVRIRDLLLEKARYVLVKASPMLDISLALKQLPESRAVHVVSVDGECKELLFLLAVEPVSPGVEIVCVNLRTQGRDEFDVFEMDAMREARANEADRLGTYLYEPNASLLKAGAFAYLTTRYPVAKLHSNSHLYTADVCVPDFPGRVFRILDTIPYQRKAFSQRWPNVVKANITVRNFPDTVAAIRRTLKVPEGGDDYVFATTLWNGDKVLIRTVKIS